ncbi:hypothetical protein [Nostoc sp.]|uniref:hypothetical protein n=1 Tax=Nostoc sp. TaxID=1180 RepID=UPI002FF8EB08
MRYGSGNTPYSYRGFIAIALAVIGSKVSYLIQLHTDGYNNRCLDSTEIEANAVSLMKVKCKTVRENFQRY